MSFKKVDTASDLVRFGCSLKIECIACGAARTMTGMEVVEVHGRASLDRLRRRLKCRRCGKKDAKLVVLSSV